MADTVIMPKLGFDMQEGTLIRWVINEGEAVAKGAVLAEIETDKATVEVESSFEGVMAKHLAPAGEVVPVNTPIAIIAAPGEQVDELAKGQTGKVTKEQEGEAAKEQIGRTAREQKAEESAGAVRASPLARKLAHDRGIDLGLVKGTGPGGRIVKKDIEAYAAPPKAAPTPGPTPLLAQMPHPAAQTIPLNRLRAAIGRRMVEAKQSVPHFYVTHEYDMAALMALRKQINALLPEEGKVSVNDFIVKGAALALREFPNLNASLQGDQIVQHGAVNMGVAVALNNGLLTVVCRDADHKPLRQIANEVKSMAARAREGKVRPEDIEGSTFSISNLGMFDVEHFIAIINPPEAGILAVGSVREVPAVKDGVIAPGLRLKATISVDHRVSDGAEAARFMQALAKYLEEPLSLLVA
jgi:pyruvate dehydrogenase E2 component (dihydrolipoamide acetyltransferase)